MANLKISVIIPCYNVSHCIQRCLDSIRLQKYDNLEVICIDDGSQDDTLVILKNYQTTHLNFNLIIHSQSNQGVSQARNWGIDCATGKLMIFLDADDYLIIKSQLFFKANAHFQANPQLDYLGYKSWLLIEKLQIFFPNLTINDHSSKDLNTFLIKNVSGFVWKAFYRTQIVKTYQIKFINEIQVGEDLIWHTNYCLKAKKFAFLQDYAHVYCFHESNVSVGAAKRNFELVNSQFLKLVEHLITTFKENVDDCSWIKKNYHEICLYLFWYNLFLVVGWEYRKLLKIRFELFFTIQKIQPLLTKHDWNFLLKIPHPKSLYQIFIYYTRLKPFVRELKKLSM